MKYNREIRAKARQELKGYWTMPVLATLIYLTISSACAMPNILSASLDSNAFQGLSFLLQVFFLFPLVYGFTIAFLLFLREDKENTVESIFVGFKTYTRALAIILLKNVIIFLFSLLLIVPGFIKMLSYSMACYVSKDHPELSAYECLKRSKDLMWGHKWKLFLLLLSFLGWGLLCLLTLGIGFLWLYPYASVSMAVFYESLMEDYELKDADKQGVESDHVVE